MSCANPAPALVHVVCTVCGVGSIFIVFLAPSPHVCFASSY